MKKKDRR